MDGVELTKPVQTSMLTRAHHNTVLLISDAAAVVPIPSELAHHFGGL